MRFPIVLTLASTVLVGAVLAQSPGSFEVVSIKPNKSGAPGSETDTTPGRVSVLNATPLSLLLRAFGVSGFQIVGAPNWVLTDRYDVVATVPDGRVLNDQDRKIGLQSLWLARAVDALRGELHRGFGRVEARLDRLDGREPPSLRRA